MKKLSFIALATVMIVALGTGMAFADAFNVTSNFGVRVTEQGASERVGAITLSPNEIGSDIFDPGPPAGAAPSAQVITVELLGNATISRTFGADYNWNGGNAAVVFDPTDVPAIPVAANDYRVVAIEGDDFFTIEVTDVMDFPSDTIQVGHNEPDGADDSALCFNLVGTIYNSSDPARQLVQVSYSDGLSNTYSGDIFVATVKPKSVLVNLCDKSLPTEVLTPDSLDQDADCGIGTYSSCMFTFEDNAAGALLGDYEFTLGKTTGAKAGVGFSGVRIEKFDSVLGTWDLVDLVTGVVERRNTMGAEIVIGDFSGDTDLLALNTSEIVIAATLTGPGLYRALGSYVYDTCVATDGIWTIDIFANRVPCGGSWSEIDWDIVEFFTPTGAPTSYAFPYAVNNVANYINGIVFTNRSVLSITIDATLVEMDGDVYTGQVVVPASQMAVGFVADVLSPTTTGSDAAFGDEPYAIYTTGTGLYYGFLFIANGNQAQGYLPIQVGGF